MQLTYNFNPAIGVEGQVAEYREGTIIVSKVAEGSVRVGKLCAPGTRGEVGPSTTAASRYGASPGQATILPNGLVADPMVDSVWIGIPIYDSSRPPYSSSNEYLDTEPMAVLRRGVIWVLSETAVTQYANVYVRNATAGTDVKGSWRMGAAGSFVLFSRGRWMTTTTGPGLAMMEVF